MLMPTIPKKRPHPQQQKRHGNHHTKSARYAKVYLPYLPLLLIAVLGTLLSFLPRTSWDVLAYASSLSHQTLLSETNKERARANISDLSLNQLLSNAAQAKAEDMAARDYWSHNTPDGQEPWIFVTGAGYEYKKAGENLAYGFRSSETTVGGWMNSQTHKENMLDPVYTEVGFGYANAPNFQGKGEVTIVVAMYGNPLNSNMPVNLAAPSRTPSPAPVTTESPVTRQEVKQVNVIEAASSGRAAWLSFAVGLVSGISIAVLILKHGLLIRKLFVRGEDYVMHHPIFDLVLLSLAVVGILLTRTTGFIV